MPSKSGQSALHSAFTGILSYPLISRHLHESQNASALAASGKTPYGAGGRTPARHGATPGHASTRQPARTPNVYGANRTPNPYGGPGGGRTPNAYAAGGRTPNPNAYAGAPTGHNGSGGSGWGAPGLPPPPPPSMPSAPSQPPPSGGPGMNPERAAMMNSASGWGSAGWS
jgi:hypothetical protein